MLKVEYDYGMILIISNTLNEAYFVVLILQSKSKLL